MNIPLSSGTSSVIAMSEVSLEAGEIFPIEFLFALFARLEREREREFFFFFFVRKRENSVFLLKE